MKRAWARARRALRHAQLRPMPALQAHFKLRRWAWWATGLMCAGFGLFFLLAAVEDGWKWDHTDLALSGVALWWSALSVFVFAAVLPRPRHTAEGLATAALDRASNAFDLLMGDASYAGPPSDTGVFIPGSSRLSWALVVVAGGWAISFTLISVAAESTWRVVWAGLAGLLAFAVVSGALAIRSRWLLLTPEWIYVAGSRASAQLRWDDISSFSYVQSYDGMMVYRLNARHGVTTQPTRRHPFTRARPGSLDIEFASLDLDPLLLALAIEVYWSHPTARTEIGGPMPPVRLTDPVKALEGVQLAEHLAEYRPESPR